jgi:hypothetical protein
MITKIVERINAYSASVSKPVTAVEFGGDTLPAPPYVVVKQERDAGGAGTAFRIITHFKPGQQAALRSFNRQTIGEALDDFSATNAAGNFNELSQDWDSFPGPIFVGNDDKTISLERLYYMGDRLY